MKKIVSIVLLYALLLMCFSGCSTSDSKEDTREELDIAFKTLKADSEAIEKMFGYSQIFANIDIISPDEVENTIVFRFVEI